MEKCLVIINKNAGKCRKCSTAKVAEALGERFEYDTVFLPRDDEINFSGYRNVAVCGGDGTLSTILQQVYSLQKNVYYFPCGTLNDKAKAKRHGGKTELKNAVVGKADGEVFTYVFAAGAFTPIGYAADVKNKQRFGVLAYAAKILEAYRVNRIKAEIKTECDGRTETVSGEYNLIMFIKSPRCFGFKFNRAYDENSKSGHLIAIASPGRGGLLGKISMFFPFFRVFFIGLKKETSGKILFKEVTSAFVTLPSLTSFCADGEQRFMSGTFDVNFEETTCKLVIVKNN